MTNTAADLANPKPCSRETVLAKQSLAARVSTWTLRSFMLVLLSALAWMAFAAAAKPPLTLVHVSFLVTITALTMVAVGLTLWAGALEAAWGEETASPSLARLLLLTQVSEPAREFVREVLGQGRKITRGEAYAVFYAYGKTLDKELVRQFEPPRGADAFPQR